MKLYVWSAGVAFSIGVWFELVVLAIKHYRA